MTELEVKIAADIYARAMSNRLGSSSSIASEIARDCLRSAKIFQSVYQEDRRM